MTAQVTLVGRDAQLDSLARFLAGVADSGAVKLLLGNPGVGKTRLLESAAGMARQSGCTVLPVSGIEYEGDISYSSLHQLLRPVMDRFATLSTPQRSALEVALGIRDGEAPNPLLVCHAVHTLLAALAAEHPVVLTVDDVLWLDRASAIVFGFVARRLEGTNVRVIAALRTVEATLFDANRVNAEIIPPLSRSDAEQLLLSARPTLSAEARRAVLDHAEGNPLAILELADELDRAGLLPAHSLPRILPVSERLESTFAFRVTELPVDTRRALLVLALDARDDLATVVDCGFDLDTLAPAERVGLLTVDLSDQRVRFRHPLVRSVVVSNSTASERQRAHLLIADHGSEDSDRQAWHLAEGTSRPDPAVAALLEAAGRRALSRGDATGATRVLSRAAQLSSDPAERARLLAEVAYLGAEVTGEVDQSTDLLTYLQSSNGRGALHAAAANTRLYTAAGGDYSTAHRRVRQAVYASDHSWGADDSELIDTLHHWITMCWLAGRDENWPPLLAALDQLKPAAPNLLVASALALADPAHDGRRARDLLLPAIREIDSERDITLVAKLHLAATFVDLGPACREASLRIVENARRGAVNEIYLRSLIHICLVDFRSGRWDEARRLCEEGLAASETVTYPLNVWYFLYMQALLHAARGDHEGAVVWAERLDDAALTRGSLGAYRFGLHARTLDAVAGSDWEAAYRYASAISPAASFVRCAPTALWVAYDLVEAAVHTGRRAEARAHHAAMVELGLSELSTRLALITAGAGALVGDDENWQDLYEEALATEGASDWPFDLARIQFDYGQRLRRARNLARSRELLHLALDTFERLGARPWIDRALQELRAAHDPSGRQPHEHEELTPQEQAIAELAAVGLSNKEIGSRLFLSPRTVGGHLYRIFPKLGVTSRAALRDALAEYDLPSGLALASLSHRD